MTIPQTPSFADTDLTVRGGEDFVLLLQGRRPSCASLDWFREHRRELMAALANYGAVFFRGFGGDPKHFEQVLEVLVPEPFEMLDVVTPRAHVRDTLYTSTQAHPAIDIPQHQEMSYHSHPPWYLGFYCEVPSEGDGFTPVNDLRSLGREVRRLYPAVLDRFIEHGVLFVRNFNKLNYKSWQTCWEATTHEEVEAKLRRSETEFEWVDDDWLRTFQRRPAVLRDPVSQAEIFYPSLNIFHRTFIEHIAAIQRLPLPGSQDEQSLVAYFGDGSPIPEDFLAWVRERSVAGRVSIPWRARDFFLINNLIAGHGRTPYSNPARSVLASFRGTIDLRAFQVTSATAGHREAAPGHARPGRTPPIAVTTARANEYAQHRGEHMDPTRPFEARPFDDHDVKPRRTWFTFPKSIPPLWLWGSPIRTHFFDAINMFVPTFEEFAVRVMKQRLPSIDDAALREQLRGFMGQEATHSKVHNQYNVNLRDYGYRFATYVKLAELVAELLERRGGTRLSLAVVAGFEHVTAVLSEVTLDGRMLDDAPPEMRALYEWHTAEELEHKMLAFDYFRAIDGSYPLRVVGGVLGVVIVLGFTLSGMFLLAAQDPGFVAPRTARDLRALFFGKERLLPRLLGGCARYFAPRFHPSERDTRQYSEAVLGRARGAGVA